MSVASARIKSLVSFAPSCSKYQSPFNELARVPFFRVIQIIESMREKKKCTSFRPCISTAMDLSCRASFVLRAFPTLSRITPDSCSREFWAEFWFLIVQIEDSVFGTHYDSGRFIVCHPFPMITRLINLIFLRDFSSSVDFLLQN